MSDNAANTVRVFCLPLRTIKEHFGNDAIDEAGDFLMNNLRELSDLTVQTGTDFSLDTSHQNSWFHSLRFTVNGLSESMVREFVGSARQEGVELEVEGDDTI